MGSYCSLKFDDTDLFIAKSVVPDDFVAIFQESDRIVWKTPETEDDEACTEIHYRAPRDVVLRRLDLLGCTDAVVKARFDEWRAAEKKSWEEFGAGYGGAEETLQALDTLDYATWQRRSTDLLKVPMDKWPDPVDEIDRQLRDSDDGWLHFDGYASLITLRGLLDALPDALHITLDIGDLVDNGYIDAAEPLCTRRRETDHGEIRNLAPTMILAEGSTDIRILENSLATLHPEVKDYFSFFDHRELNVDGGASYLVKFLKAFAAARAPLQMVAIFDNDAAGTHAAAQARALKLPSNIRVMTLPDIKLAERYPTVGAQGNGVGNVNGRAASIELYLGRNALSDGSGGLRPVRWGGYYPPVKAYQGEVEGKAEIHSTFFGAIASVADAVAARNTFPDLEQVWQAIFRNVEQSMDSARRNEVQKAIR